MVFCVNYANFAGMKRSILLSILLLLTLGATAQQAVQNKQRHFPKTVPPGNYSGITWMVQSDSERPLLLEVVTDIDRDRRVWQQASETIHL